MAIRGISQSQNHTLASVTVRALQARGRPQARAARRLAPPTSPRSSTAAVLIDLRQQS
eukprot:CAMPEP_0173441426 /NCGR_PEP_ID=MMETSP1357-20121228/23952_1 /TAXON_ID=77926 /ORGANISM="Hemiselmis rufescens, Strain PCC563" /LENGTH=57 /DNA_ID=CAMNT_0014407007 /DNA_START=234 /DNA_END=408 /DNA_ORIENTATION=-